MTTIQSCSIQNKYEKKTKKIHQQTNTHVEMRDGNTYDAKLSQNLIHYYKHLCMRFLLWRTKQENYNASITKKKKK